MANILDFFTKGGQARTQDLIDLENRIAEAARYYLGPTGIDKRAGSAVNVIGEIAPTTGITNSMAASGRGDYGEAAVEGAAALLPVGAAKIAGRYAAGGVGQVADDAANAVSEFLTGFSAPARDAGRVVAERLNQRGPMPTVYSNPLLPKAAVDDASSGVKVFHASPTEITGDFKPSKSDVGLHFAANPDLAKNAATKAAFENPSNVDAIKPYEFTIQATPEQIVEIPDQGGRFDFYAITEDLLNQGKLDEKTFNDIIDGLENIEDSASAYDDFIVDQNKFFSDMIRENTDIKALKYMNKFDAGPTWLDLEAGKFESDVQPDFSYIVLDPSAVKRPDATPSVPAAPKRGIGDNGGPRLNPLLPKAEGKPTMMIGEDIATRLSKIPSAREVQTGQSVIPASGVTNVKTQKPIALSTHKNLRQSTGERVNPEVASFEMLQDRDVLGIVGDNSGRHNVLGVNDDVFETPQVSQAGFEYIDVDGQGYAGALTAQSGKFKEALKSKDPYYMSWMMGQQSPDFAMHTGMVFGEMFKHAPIAIKDAPKIDESIRKIGMSVSKDVIQPDGTKKKISQTIYPFTDFKSVSDPAYVQEYIRQIPTGSQRAAFLKGMDKSGLQKLGVPRVADARLAVADENQLGMDWGSVGYRGFTPDLEKGLLPTTAEQSRTYDTGIDKVGRAQTFTEGSRGIPSPLVFQDTSLALRQKGTGGLLDTTSAEYKVYEGSHKRAKQRIDQRVIDTVQTFLEVEKTHGRGPALEFAKRILTDQPITSEMIKAAKKANAPAWVLGAMSAAAAGDYVGGRGQQEGL